MISGITPINAPPLAHTSKINCLAFGKNSASILVTGSDDCKVNLHALDEHSTLLASLPHASSIESIAIDWCEEIVAAGTSTGSIKLWDTTQQKVIRTLNGHSNAIKSLTFHPFGDFFVSSTVECLKVWDIRRKGCIQTYPTKLDNLCITPDGKWVAGVKENGVEVWDMTSGKKMYEFEGNAKYCGFHPGKLSMVVGGSDGICFYDLTTGSKEDSLEFDGSPVEMVQFGTDDSLYAIHTDGITVCKMDPSLQVINKFDCRLGDVRDTILTAGHLRIAIIDNEYVHIVSINPEVYHNFTPRTEEISLETLVIAKEISNPFIPIEKHITPMQSQEISSVSKEQANGLTPLSMDSPLNISYAPFLDIPRHTFLQEGEYLDKHADIMDIINFRLTNHTQTREQFDDTMSIHCIFQGESWQTNDLIKRAKGLCKTTDDFLVVLKVCTNLCFEVVEEWIVSACLCMHGMILKFRGILDQVCLNGLLKFKECLIGIGRIKGTDALKDVIDLIDEL